MAVTQYIGARYVPDFASPVEWNNTRTYDPLTIVTHQGNSYTSRQFVPQGVDIANDAFWALTGNYNAQVEQYRKEVLDVSNELSVTNNNIDVLHSKVGELEKEAGELEKEVRDGIYLCLGDSWVAEGTIAGIISKQKNLKLVNKAVSGGSFTKYPTYVKTVGEEIADAALEISDKSLVKLVTIVAGVNDVSHHGIITQDDINTEAAKAFKSARSNFPKAEIVFATDAPYSTDFLSLSHYYYSLEQLQEVSYYNKVTFVNLCNMFNDKGLYKDDNLHPNAAGCGYVASMLLGGVSKNVSQLIQKTSGDAIYLYFQDEMVYLNYSFAAGSERNIKLDRFFAFKVILNVPRVGAAVKLTASTGNGGALIGFVDTIGIPRSESTLYGFIVGTISVM